jgi:hypothetical protein
VLALFPFGHRSQGSFYRPFYIMMDRLVMFDIPAHSWPVCSILHQRESPLHPPSSAASSRNALPSLRRGRRPFAPTRRPSNCVVRTCLISHGHLASHEYDTDINKPTTLLSVLVRWGGNHRLKVGGDRRRFIFYAIGSVNMEGPESDLRLRDRGRA